MTAPGEPPTPPPSVPPERSIAGPTPIAELAPPPPSTSDWPAQATDAIVDLVDQVRDKTTGPAITVARGLVFGLIAGVLGTVAAVLLLIFVIRLTTEVLELIWDGADVWLTYLIYGVLFTAIGAVVFGKRHVRGLD
jgi:hypothetical protein